MIQADETLHLIRVGYFQNEPVVYKDPAGKPKGLYVDLITRIAEKENWQVQFVFGNWDQCLLRLKNNGLDLMTSIAPSQEREKEMVFSSENILTMWGQVYVRKNSGIEDVLDLAGLRVILLKDGINGINFKAMMGAFGINCRFLYVDSYENGAAILAKDKASAMVVNNVHGRILKNTFNLVDTPIMFNPFKLVFAVSKNRGKSSLLDTIDRHIREWKGEDQSYYYQRLWHWYGDREPAERVIPQWLILALFASILTILIAFFWVRSLSLQIKKRDQAERAKERLIVKLQNALEEIKTLSGLLPICASCKKIRDDKGYWNQIESHIQHHSEAKFSHGICPECLENLYDGQEWYGKMKKEKGSK